MITCSNVHHCASHIYNLYSRYDIAHLTLKITLHEFITLVDGDLRYIIPCATYIHYIIFLYNQILQAPR